MIAPSWPLAWELSRVIRQPAARKLISTVLGLISDYNSVPYFEG
jgi:hypothetical protein